MPRALPRLTILPLALLAATVTSACATLAPARGGGGGGELIGLSAPISASVSASASAGAGPARSLAVDGAAAGRPAVIRIDLSSPLTRASTACFAGAPRSQGVVRFRRPWGTPVELPEASLDGLEIAGRRLGRRLVAVEPGGGAGCEVWLGTDALGQVAVDVDFTAGTVAFSASRPRSGYQGALALDRDPTTDWLLVPVRLRFGEVEMGAPFVLSTASERSTLGEGAAAAAGLPRAEAHAPALLELEPGASLRSVTLVNRSDWTSTAAVGELGADVWGRFNPRIDVGSSVLVLSKPAAAAAEGSGLTPPAVERAVKEETSPPEPEPEDPR